MSERLSQGTGTTRYRAADPDRPFRSLSSMVQTGSLTMTCTASTAVTFEVANPPYAILILPLAGSTRVTQGRREVVYQAHKTAAFMPAQDSSGIATRRSAVGIAVRPDVLEPLACHMLGRDPGGAPLLELAAPRALPLVSGGVRFDPIFRHLMGLVDQYASSPDLLARSGLEDAIHRAAIMLLHPELFHAQEEKHRPERRKTALACDYIRANLDRKITLTELEQISGLSPRLLQYAFQERYGCSPMQWVTGQRLETVHSALMSAPPGATVSAIASHYFGNMGDFARKYRDRFGEPPSVTLARRRHG